MFSLSVLVEGSFLGAGGVFAVAGQVVGREDRQEGDQHHRHRHHVGDRPLARAHQFLEHPDRQRGLLAGGEGGHDDLVEAQRKGQHAARQQRSADVGQDHQREGLQPVGAEIHRRVDQRPRGAAEPRHGVVVDDDDAEGRVAQHDGPRAEGDLQQRPSSII